MLFAPQSTSCVLYSTWGFAAAPESHANHDTKLSRRHWFNIATRALRATKYACRGHFSTSRGVKNYVFSCVKLIIFKVFVSLILDGLSRVQATSYLSPHLTCLCVSLLWICRIYLITMDALVQDEARTIPCSGLDLGWEVETADWQEVCISRLNLASLA